MRHARSARKEAGELTGELVHGAAEISPGGTDDNVCGEIRRLPRCQECMHTFSERFFIQRRTVRRKEEGTVCLSAETQHDIIKRSLEVDKHPGGFRVGHGPRIREGSTAERNNDALRSALLPEGVLFYSPELFFSSVTKQGHDGRTRPCFDDRVQIAIRVAEGVCQDGADSTLAAPHEPGEIDTGEAGRHSGRGHRSDTEREGKLKHDAVGLRP